MNRFFASALAAGLLLAAAPAPALAQAAPAGPTGTVTRIDCQGTSAPLRGVALTLSTPRPNGGRRLAAQVQTGRDGTYAFRRAGEAGQILQASWNGYVFDPPRQVLTSANPVVDFVASPSPTLCRLIELIDAGVLLPERWRALRDRLAQILYQNYQPGLNDDPADYPATARVIKQFQWEHDLYQTGRVDVATRAVLFSPDALHRLKEGDSADSGPLSVAGLRQLLTGAGYLAASDATAFDRDVTGALRAFQIDYGMLPSGVFTVEAQAALQSAARVQPPRPQAPATSALAAIPIFKSQYHETVFNPVSAVGPDNCGPSSLSMALELWGFERKGLGGERLTVQQRINYARALINAGTLPVKTNLANAVVEAFGARMPRNPAATALRDATPALIREGVTVETLGKVAAAGGITTPADVTILAAFEGLFTSARAPRRLVVNGGSNGELRLAHGILVLEASYQLLDETEIENGVTQAALWAQSQQPSRTITHGVVSGLAQDDAWKSLDDHLSRGPVVAHGLASTVAGWGRQAWSYVFPVPAAYGGIDGGSTLHIIAILGKTAEGLYVVADPLYASYRTWPGIDDGGGPVTMTREQLERFIRRAPVFNWIEATPACADVALVNPSFEDPVIAGPWVRVNEMPGWTGPVDIHRAPDLPASEGAQVIDLNQNDAGWVAQSFATAPGATYRVEFFHGVNDHCTSSATFAVQIDGQTVATLTTGSDPVHESVIFKANGATTELRFVSLTGGCGATTIDAVSVMCNE